MGTLSKLLMALFSISPKIDVKERGINILHKKNVEFALQAKNHANNPVFNYPLGYFEARNGKNGTITIKNLGVVKNCYLKVEMTAK